MRVLTVFAALLFISSCSMVDPVVEEPQLGADGIDSTGLYDTSVTADGDTVINKVDSSGNIIIDTTDGSGDKGVVIVSERSEILTFDETLDSGKILVAVDTISLADIRNEIAKENMSLALFNVSNVSLKKDPDSPIIPASYLKLPAVITIETALPGDTFELALMTPDSGDFYPVKTLGEILNGLELNGGIYAKAGALKSFEDKIKFSSSDDILFRVKLRVDGTVVLPKNFSLIFTIEGTSKKKL